MPNESFYWGRRSSRWRPQHPARLHSVSAELREAPGRCRSGASVACRARQGGMLLPDQVLDVPIVFLTDVLNQLAFE